MKRTTLDLEKILELYQDKDMSLKEVAKKVSCSGITISRFLKKNGVCVRSRGARHGPKNHKWKGGRRKDGQGYILIRVAGRYRNEHRVVMEKMLGRKLKRSEIVHHIDRDRTNNRPENLELLGQKTHSKRHPSKRRINVDVKELIRLYKKTVNAGEVARQINLSYYLVRNRLREMGISTKKEYYVRHDLDLKRIVKLYRRGLSMRQIAIRLSTDGKTIKSRLIKMGIL